MKEYPLCVDFLSEWIDQDYEGSVMGFWSKGHHEFSAFQDAMELEDLDEMRTKTRARFIHEWWRVLPNRMMQVLQGPGRGVFPVSVWYLGPRETLF